MRCLASELMLDIWIVASFQAVLNSQCSFGNLVRGSWHSMGDAAWIKLPTVNFQVKMSVFYF